MKKTETQVVAEKTVARIKDWMAQVNEKYEGREDYIAGLRLAVEIVEIAELNHRCEKQR